MDRSFLSQAEVIAASRRFVCVRLATYESAEEAAVLSHIFVGPTGALENTVFALLAPDGQTLLARPGRSPDFAFSDAQDMAQAMDRIAQQYPGRNVASAPLPVVADVRLAIDIAACEHLPLVVVTGPDRLTTDRLASTLASVAWLPDVMGRAVYVTTFRADDRRLLQRATGQQGIAVVRPDRFGTTGQVLTWLDGGTPAPQLHSALAGALGAYSAPVEDTRDHIEAGRSQGIFWQTAIPVTDPHGPPP